MAEEYATEETWEDFLKKFDVNHELLNELERDTREITEAVEGRAHEDENCGQPDQPGARLEIENLVGVEYFPLVDTESGEIKKLYEILMTKLGIEIPELKDENLSDLEKALRQEKKDNLIIFEVERQRGVRKTPNEIFDRSFFICSYLLRKRVPIKTARSVDRLTPQTMTTKVKLWFLEDKKQIMAKRYILNGSRFKIDHDLTSLEINLQSLILNFWKVKQRFRNQLVIIPEKINLCGDWYTIVPASQSSPALN